MMSHHIGEIFLQIQWARQIDLNECEDQQTLV